jgi:hypothetical protein
MTFVSTRRSRRFFVSNTAATVAFVGIVAAGVLGGCTSANPTADGGHSRPSPAAVMLDSPANGCGSVTYPATGQSGALFVAAGTIGCGDAMTVVNRYLHDSTLVHEGNTWSAQFDGWTCAIPTAVAAEQDGYTTSCSRGSDEIRVGPVAYTSTAPMSNDCERTAIAHDLGPSATAVRCYGPWAYVDFGELGDSQSLARLVNGTWTVYSAFPSAKCRAQAAADGVPVPELTSFQPC